MLKQPHSRNEESGGSDKVSSAAEKTKGSEEVGPQQQPTPVTHFGTASRLVRMTTSLMKPKEIEARPIRRLPNSLLTKNLNGENEAEDLEDMPDVSFVVHLPENSLKTISSKKPKNTARSFSLLPLLRNWYETFLIKRMTSLPHTL